MQHVLKTGHAANCASWQVTLHMPPENTRCVIFVYKRHPPLGSSGDIPSELLGPHPHRQCLICSTAQLLHCKCGLKPVIQKPQPDDYDAQSSHEMPFGMGILLNIHHSLMQPAWQCCLPEKNAQHAATQTVAMTWRHCSTPCHLALHSWGHGRP